MLPGFRIILISNKILHLLFFRSVHDILGLYFPLHHPDLVNCSLFQVTLVTLDTRLKTGIELDCVS